ncbi:tyrosine--tRNA ligase, mitochondrial isoform X1 [Ptiloglossa arizonensis]|uniref:tyrosine--tRNA ligase, mitochondrial isoform X1 n=1 Tax=Ptiloglossa arizonensis TaxID=3350558 RepID=UPI003FA07D81
MNNLVRLCSFAKHFSVCRLHTTKFVIDAENRQLYENVFPNIYMENIKKLWNSPPQCVYAGFDPTAESLHIGNLLVLINLLHWQRCGHQVIILLGGATGLIGDPSFRKTERVEIENVVLEENLKSIQNDIKNIFENHKRYFYNRKKNLIPIIIHNNLEWYNNMNMLSFIKDIGKYFRMGTMLGRNSVESRLQSDIGMSFTEFSYPLLQGYDWLHLQRTYKCNFQIGGQDQMGNIMSGYDLVSKCNNKEVYGLTLPLITSEGGKKFGKSTGNVIWLSPSKSSSFQFYQYFIRAKDADLENLFQFFTFLPLNRIKDIVKNHFLNPELRNAQNILAEEVTLLVHGEEGLVAAKRASSILYSKSIESLSRFNANELLQILEGATLVDILSEPGINIYELALKAKCFKTEQEAKRIISSGGFYVNYQKITNIDEIVVPGVHILSNNVTLLRVGKKSYFIVRWL